MNARKRAAAAQLGCAMADLDTAASCLDDAGELLTASLVRYLQHRVLSVHASLATDVAPQELPSDSRSLHNGDAK